MAKPGLVISAVVTCLLVSAAEAVSLTYVVEGTITQKSDRGHLLDGIAVGDGVTYTITVDENSPNLTRIPGWGRYATESAVLRLGESTCFPEPPRIEVIADWSDNPTSMFSIPVTTVFGGLLGSGMFMLSDDDKTAIPSPSLPSGGLDVLLFESRYLYLSIPNPNIYGDSSSVYGTIDSFAIIPEAATCTLLGCFVLFGVLKHSHRRITAR